VQRVRKSLFLALLVSATALSPLQASAETIMGALTKAYQYNSSLNSARAGVRVTDEDVAIAKSGYRPTVQGAASIDYSNTSRDAGSAQLTTGSFGVSINQTLFDGFQTKNNVAAAEARVAAQQESLRNTEENTLFAAAQAYMNVIHDRKVAALTQQNLEAMNEQVRSARSRFEVGEGTRTDVAQTEAARSLATAQVTSARAQVRSSEAAYRQIVGDAPGKLKVASPLAKLLPRSLDTAIAVAFNEHPAILATQHLVDAAGFSVKSAEGAMLPQITASAGVSRDYRNTASGSLPGVGAVSDGYSNSASIGATLTIPIYQGGRTSAIVRQSKEQLGQARIEVDVSRDQVRNQIVSAWTLYTAARENVDANQAQVAAQQLALDGVIEERKVGQRTTLDVLNAQNDVINARINLASAERDVVTASYAILQATGRLSIKRLGLQVTEYHPEEHYKAVKDKWYGLRTPDGR
jgi:outer membrane protein